MTALARTTDPDTSHQAAASLPDLRPSQDAVLRILRGLIQATDPELVAAYRRAVVRGEVPPQSSSGIRTRRRELVEARRVTATSVRVRQESGRCAQVWRVTP